jgi:hypothetical protein
MRRLRRQLFRGLLQVGGIELRKIARDTLLQLGAAPFYLRASKVLIAVVHRLELASINRNARLREQAHPATHFDKLHADLLDRWPIILAKVGNGLVIGDKSARQPHHLDIARSLPLQPTARLNTVEVPVNVELQEHRGMI